MRRIALVLGLAGICLGLLVGIPVGALVAKGSDGDIRCLHGAVEVAASEPDERFVRVAVIGESLICARDWHIADRVIGPTLDDFEGPLYFEELADDE